MSQISQSSSNIPCIGMDLGTSWTRVASFYFKTTLNKLSSPSITNLSSYAFYDNDSMNWQFDEDASLSISSPNQVLIPCLLRFIGRYPDDPSVKTLAKYLSLKVVASSDGMFSFLIKDRQFSPTDILAEYLRFIKKKLTLQDIHQDSLCIALPALFNRLQHISLAKAAHKAGLSEFFQIPASLAASLEMGREFENTQTLAVVHFGAGVFDICVVEIGDGVFDILYYGGDPNLGGIDFDRRIYELFLEEINPSDRNQIEENALTRQIIQQQIRIAKETLSQSPEGKEEISLTKSDSDSRESFKWNLSTDKFNEAISNLLQRVRHNCILAAVAVQDSSKLPVQVILIGGMTRLQSVRQAILQAFQSNTPPVDLDEGSIAVGAAIKTGIWTGKVRDLLLLDVYPHALSVLTSKGHAIQVMPRNTTIPASKSVKIPASLHSGSGEKLKIIEGELQSEDMNSRPPVVIAELSPLPEGTETIEVSITIDARGGIGYRVYS